MRPAQELKGCNKYRALNSLMKTQVVVQTVQSRDGLYAICNSATELVIWKRSLPAQLQTWLGQMNIHQLPHARVLVKTSDIRRAMEFTFKNYGVRMQHFTDLLIKDIEGLALVYAEITGEEMVDIRLERVRDNACWKFHRDNVKTRLLTTYRGPNTEWVLPEYGEQALRQQLQFEGPIESLAPHDVAIFNGCSSASGSGIVHRSPPIEGTGYTRLLLCLNQKSDTSPDPWSDKVN